MRWRECRPIFAYAMTVAVWIGAIFAPSMDFVWFIVVLLFTLLLLIIFRVIIPVHGYRWGKMLLVVILVGGCTKTETGHTEIVRIVQVHCEKRGGEGDCRTIVQFPDSTRWDRMDNWGAVGDTFKARKKRFGAQSWWE